jgi:hypothetical protein
VLIVHHEQGFLDRSRFDHWPGTVFRTDTCRPSPRGFWREARATCHSSRAPAILVPQDPDP